MSDKAWRKEVRSIVDDTIAEIEYVPEPNDENHWQTPAETLKLGTGDCEDIQILIRARLIDFNLITKSRLLLGVDDKYGEHAVLKVWHEGRAYHICNMRGLHRKLHRFTTTRSVGDVFLDAHAGRQT